MHSKFDLNERKVKKSNLYKLIIFIGLKSFSGRIFCSLFRSSKLEISSETHCLRPRHQRLHGGREDPADEGRDGHHSRRPQRRRQLQHHHLQLGGGELEPEERRQ